MRFRAVPEELQYKAKQSALQRGRSNPLFAFRAPKRFHLYAPTVSSNVKYSVPVALLPHTKAKKAGE